MFSDSLLLLIQSAILFILSCMIKFNSFKQEWLWKIFVSSANNILETSLLQFWISFMYNKNNSGPKN